MLEHNQYNVDQYILEVFANSKERIRHNRVLYFGLNYPNDFDRMMAKKEGRRSLGGDIMIHGNEVSIGCLAMGDQTAEDLFILSALVRTSLTKILISPTDFRVNPHFSLPKKPQWVKNLYQEIQSHLTQFKRS